MEFKYKQTYYIQTYMNMQYMWCVVGAPILVGTSCNHTSERAYLVCGGGPNFSGNLMQSYIRTCIICCLVGPPFQWQPYAIIHSNMHYLGCGGGPPFLWEPHAIIHSNKHIWCVAGSPISVGTSGNHTFEHALFVVWWGPHFSGNLMQSYIRTCIIWGVVGAPILWEPHAIIHSNKHIWCVVGAPISVGTSCNHKFEHALFGVWWGPPF